LLTEGVAVAVEGVDFAGLRSVQFSEMVRLFRDVIGVPLARETSGMAGFRLCDGTVLEIYRPADEFHSFFTTGPVVGLRVGTSTLSSRGLVTPSGGVPPYPRMAA
jgi:hypothetical protein